MAAGDFSPQKSALVHVFFHPPSTHDFPLSYPSQISFIKIKIMFRPPYVFRPGFGLIGFYNGIFLSQAVNQPYPSQLRHRSECSFKVSHWKFEINSFNNSVRDATCVYYNISRGISHAKDFLIRTSDLHKKISCETLLSIPLQSFVRSFACHHHPHQSNLCL